jgi:hypothetical protein
VWTMKSKGWVGRCFSRSGFGCLWLCHLGWKGMVYTGGKDRLFLGVFVRVWCGSFWVAACLWLWCYIMWPNLMVVGGV